MRKLIRNCIVFLMACVMLLSMGVCSLAETSNSEAASIQTTVIEIEKYGHAVLNLTTADVFSAGYTLGDIVSVRFGSFEFNMPFYDGYYTSPGDVMLRGFSPEKNIAVCINYGDFSEETGIALGDTVEIAMVEKAGMLAYQELCSLQYSDDRADYSDDAVFANFRAVTAGSIGNGKLYRSASPINNEHGRARYANALIRDAGVATILNLADSDEDIAQYCAAEDFDSAYYLALYEDGKVMALDLAVNYFSDKFADSLLEGLRHLANNNPPYSIHCTEGKDRAGFTLMLLEALMGAQLQEIIDDYMLSFYNYYGINKESEPARYEAILNNNLIDMLCHVAGADSMETLEKIDLESAVTNYLLQHGMTENEILTLKNKLR